MTPRQAVLKHIYPACPVFFSDPEQCFCFVKDHSDPIGVGSFMSLSPDSQQTGPNGDCVVSHKHLFTWNDFPVT